jgi:hypothetical protein
MINMKYVIHIHRAFTIHLSIAVGLMNMTPYTDKASACRPQAVF